MIEEQVHFYSNTLKLEGVLTYNEDSPPGNAILLCAPHPNLGGDMENNVITSIAKVAANMGFVSLRFNYRGVGNSEYSTKDIAQKYRYWEETLSSENYMDAVNDTHTALDYLISQTHSDKSFFIAGYSFGSIVGMRAGVDHNKVTAFASVSLPFGKYDLSFLQNCRKSKLFIYNRNDFATTFEETLNGIEKIPPPKAAELIQDSGHFYRGREYLVSEKICHFFMQDTRDMLL